MSTGNHTLDDVAGGEVPSADESVLLEIPKFNWGAFFVPPIWGIVNRQWWGVLFLPAWVFVDNMLRSESTLGAWTTLAGIGMAAATLALQAVYARLADSLALRRFVGIDLDLERVPDETTICRFRHLLERHDLGRGLFEQVHRHLESLGMKVSTGTIVDATIINAPSSTKNQDQARDPDMHQTRKGNQWYFGMKAHVGVDSKSKVIHSVVATAANVHDSQILPDLLHGEETRVWGDSAYRGQREVIRTHAPQARDFTNKRYRYKDRVDEVERQKNKSKSSIRAKVEHAIGVINRIFGFVKVRYRGLEKNANRLFAICALANLYMVRHYLIRARRERCAH